MESSDTLLEAFTAQFSFVFDTPVWPSSVIVEDLGTFQRMNAAFAPLENVRKPKWNQLH